MKKVAEIKTTDGTTYRLTSLDNASFQEFLDWAKGQLPDPVAEVVSVASQLPTDYRDKWLDSHLDKAVERKRLRGTLSDPDLQTLANTPEAAVKLASLMLRPEHPHLSEHDVLEMMALVDEKEMNRVQADLQRSAQHVPLAEDEAERRFFRGKGDSSRKRKR